MTGSLNDVADHVYIYIYIVHLPKLKLDPMAEEDMLSDLTAPSMQNTVRDDNHDLINPESSSGEIIYDDKLVMNPIAQASIRYAMLRDLEDNMPLATIVRQRCQQTKQRSNALKSSQTKSTSP